MIRSGEVAAAVERAINENYLQDERASAEDYTGNLLLVKDIVTRYLRGGVMLTMRRTMRSPCRDWRSGWLIPSRSAPGSASWR
ncbi:MAG: hypothetical protein ACLRMJ_06585 [Alistipes finegoldii]